jgi:hypothetical protein
MRGFSAACSVLLSSADANPSGVSKHKSRLELVGVKPPNAIMRQNTDLTAG